jgi:hypothetical protein
VAGVTDGLHYRFPPARAYPLNRCLFALKSDAGFRARFLADPKAAMGELGLEPDDQAAVLARDRGGLVARGAHPYLVFMAELRLRMEGSAGAFEYF